MAPSSARALVTHHSPPLLCLRFPCPPIHCPALTSDAVPSVVFASNPLRSSLFHWLLMLCAPIHSVADHSDSFRSPAIPSDPVPSIEVHFCPLLCLALLSDPIRDCFAPATILPIAIRCSHFRSYPLPCDAFRGMPFTCVPLLSDHVLSTPMLSIARRSVPLHSTPLASAPILCAPFHGQPIHSTPLVSLPLQCHPYHSTPVHSFHVQCGAWPSLAFLSVSSPLPSPPVLSVARQSSGLRRLLFLPFRDDVFAKRPLAVRPELPDANALPGAVNDLPKQFFRDQLHVKGRRE